MRLGYLHVTYVTIEYAACGWPMSYCMYSCLEINFAPHHIHVTRLHQRVLIACELYYSMYYSHRLCTDVARAFTARTRIIHRTINAF